MVLLFTKVDPLFAKTVMLAPNISTVDNSSANNVFLVSFGIPPLLVYREHFIMLVSFGYIKSALKRNALIIKTKKMTPI